MAHEMTEKYKSWLVSLDSDNFTMYIKTWFAFLASVHGLVLAKASKEKREWFLGQKGDGVYLDEYRRMFLNAITLTDIAKQCIREVYSASINVVRNDYPEYYFVTYYKKIIVDEKLYDKRDFSGAYCPCLVDLMIQKECLSLGLLFGDRPKIYRSTLRRPYIKVSVPTIGLTDYTLIDDPDVFYKRVYMQILAAISKSGIDGLPRDKQERLLQLAQRIMSAIREDNVHGKIFRPWIPNVDSLVEQDARVWFFDFCYSLRNVMFHRVIDPFDPRWSGIIKASFQGLRELLLANIKLIEAVDKENEAGLSMN